MDNEVVIISKPNKSTLKRVVNAVGIFVLFLLFYTQAFVHSVWVLALLSPIVLYSAIEHFSSLFINRYYFEKEKVVAADYKDGYIDELNYKDIVGWNEYFEKIPRSRDLHHLVLRSDSKTIAFEESDYKNFGEILAYVKSLNLPFDKTTKNRGFKSRGDFIISQVAFKIFSVNVITCVLSFLFFAVVMINKNQVDSIMYIEGTVSNIKYDEKYKTVRVKLVEHSEISLTCSEKDDVAMFNWTITSGKDYKEFVNMNKKFRFGISKNVYEWRVKNKLIHALDIESTTNIELRSWEAITD